MYEKKIQTNIILINGMATNNEKQRTKGLKQNDKQREKNQDKESTTERMTATAEKAREVKQ